MGRDATTSSLTKCDEARGLHELTFTTTSVTDRSNDFRATFKGTSKAIITSNDGDANNTNDFSGDHFVDDPPRVGDRHTDTYIALHIFATLPIQPSE